MQPFQMQLSKKLKYFPHIFTAFPKSGFSSEHFEKNDEPHSGYISKIIGSEIRGRNCLRSSILEQPRTVKILKGPKHSWNLRDSSFFILLITLRQP